MLSDPPPSPSVRMPRKQSTQNVYLRRDAADDIDMLVCTLIPGHVAVAPRLEVSVRSKSNKQRQLLPNGSTTACAPSAAGYN
eukprot:6206350-Pleurochrysis_carterae.AAC.4